MLKIKLGKISFFIISIIAIFSIFYFWLRLIGEFGFAYEALSALTNIGVFMVAIIGINVWKSQKRTDLKLKTLYDFNNEVHNFIVKIHKPLFCLSIIRKLIEIKGKTINKNTIELNYNSLRRDLQKASVNSWKAGFFDCNQFIQEFHTKLLFYDDLLQALMMSSNAIRANEDIAIIRQIKKP